MSYSIASYIAKFGESEWLASKMVMIRRKYLCLCQYPTHCYALYRTTFTIIKIPHYIFAKIILKLLQYMVTYSYSQSCGGNCGQNLHKITP